MTIGILAEKPSQARNFAKALGGMSGTYHGERYVIAPARGHLYELAKPEKQVPAQYADQYRHWQPDNMPWDDGLFDWKFEKRGDVSATISNIKKTFKGCDEIVIATDDDPGTYEGSGLAVEVIKQVPLVASKYSRMYFVDESAKEVAKAFVNRKPIRSIDNWSEWQVASFRNKWDYLAGLQYTRLATSYGDGQSVLRTGRLKSAMLVLIYQQMKLVNGYKKIPFYENRFRDDHGVVYSNPKEPRFPDTSKVPNVYHDSAVVLDDRSMRHSAPPKLLDLSGIASRVAPMGIKARQVTKIAQVLYEHQILSYPRSTDSTITPEQFNELLPKVDAIAKVVGADTSLLTHRAPRPTHVKPQGSHGANRPGPNVPSSLDELDQYGPGAREIYTLVAKSFLTMFGEDYRYESQSGHVADYPDFVGGTVVPKVQGWKAIFNPNDDDDDVDASSQGLGSKASPFVFEGFPPKPPYPSVKWLMRQLEKRDVGTGATRTSTYADVSNDRAKYPLLREKRGRIDLTQYGEMECRIVEGTHVADLSLTEQVMQQMRDIGDGKIDGDVLLSRVRDLIEEDKTIMANNGLTMRKDMHIVQKQGNYEKREKASGQFEGKDVSFNRVFCGHRFADDEVDQLLAGKTIPLYGLKGRTGNEFAMSVRLGMGSFKSPTTGKTVPYFGAQKVDFLDDPNRGVPNVYCGHKFTAAEKQTLEDGGSVRVTHMKSRSGNVFDADLVFEKGRLEYDVPSVFHEAEVSEADRTKLRNGGRVHLDGLISRKHGKPSTYSADCTWDAEKHRIVMHFDD